MQLTVRFPVLTSVYIRLGIIIWRGFPETLVVERKRMTHNL